MEFSPKNVSVNANGLVDLLLIAGTKQLSERALVPFIGDATIKSGCLKGIGGIIAHSVIGGKVGNIVGSALILDAVEDVTANLLGGFNVGGAAASQEW